MIAVEVVTGETIVVAVEDVTEMGVMIVEAAAMTVVAAVTIVGAAVMIVEVAETIATAHTRPVIASNWLPARIFLAWHTNASQRVGCENVSDSVRGLGRRGGGAGVAEKDFYLQAYTRKCDVFTRFGVIEGSYQR
eukprot:CAMPEP_0179481322 /NCGR_PEP_ID=MMETSP0799-20121207/59085_1 /TAXON_ID=46947 /ORGANISM="Geminigera cryophila, Strain CCMP2564" /LENGTH=134 /DNA_ID=CAMNT_0021293883 /DNA_START=96 /DNA_END=500 /DNA_ORIENTATION=-